VRVGGSAEEAWQGDDTRIMVGSTEERLITFSPIQRECLAGLIEWKLAILTGGPGSGKTTLLTALQDHYERLLITALSAKAGLRAHEVTGANHTTIASLLTPNGHERLDGVSCLVVEEASMVGSIEMAELFKNAMLHNVGKIVLCGDPDQLAPINNGSPFVDLIGPGKRRFLGSLKIIEPTPRRLGLRSFAWKFWEVR
jgi:exodeoxyribonuclease V alpha subunit